MAKFFTKLIPETSVEVTEEYDGSVVIEDAVKLITFTIEGKTYQTEQGMTWTEWCDSAYNNAPACYTDGTLVYYSFDGANFYTINGASPSGEIIADKNYTTTGHSGGTG